MHGCVLLPPPSLGLRTPPRPLLVAGPSSAGSSDSDGGLFAVPTTLPPNSRHGKLFSPSKEPELTLRQHLNSISVSRPHPPCLLLLARLSAQSSAPGAVCLTDAVGLLLAKAQEVAEPASAEAVGGPGEVPCPPAWSRLGPGLSLHWPCCPDTLLLSQVSGCLWAGGSLPLPASAQVRVAPGTPLLLHIRVLFAQQENRLQKRQEALGIQVPRRPQTGTCGGILRISLYTRSQRKTLAGAQTSRRV